MSSHTATCEAGIAYPEREAHGEGRLAQAGRVAGAMLARRLRGGGGRGLRRFASLVDDAGAELARASDPALCEAAREAGRQLRRAPSSRAAVARVFAAGREAASRTLGMRPYDVQIMGAWVLFTGEVAEMETGEGKTLTATLPAIAAALAGIPVHVVTVNDYLAARDAHDMAPLYRFFGLEVGLVRQGMDEDARRQAYACPVTYCTNKELVFDYLRDRMQVGTRSSRLQVRLERLYGARSPVRRLRLRGLHFAIVDEIDSVLVDEARTPLIISAGAGANPAAESYRQAGRLAQALVEARDFRILGAARRVELTASGRDRLEACASGLGGPWRATRRREELIVQALAAAHLYRREQHYVVHEGRVQIVDEFTGRIYPDRAWEQGLHQMIEAKEGVEITSARDPLARISYQQFFRRYLRLAGMSGTVHEIGPELRRVYRLEVRRIPTHRPGRRLVLASRVHRDEPRKWQAIAQRVAALSAAGRAVLVGTRSIEGSERLSEVLAARGVEHRVLNARQDATEADIVAAAGQSGRVTVATNMAGRGTDIVLAAACAAAGGLHVIASERHEAARIDRQLYGRCARQGDPGSCEAILSLDDEILRVHGAGGAPRLAGLALRTAPRLGQALALALFAHAQQRAEHTHARARRALLRADERLADALAFAGRRE